jgi:hypothetical protein
MALTAPSTGRLTALMRHMAGGGSDVASAGIDPVPLTGQVALVTGGGTCLALILSTGECPHVHLPVSLVLSSAAMNIRHQHRVPWFVFQIRPTNGSGLLRRFTSCRCSRLFVKYLVHCIRCDLTWALSVAVAANIRQGDRGSDCDGSGATRSTCGNCVSLLAFLASADSNLTRRADLYCWQNPTTSVWSAT